MSTNSSGSDDSGGGGGGVTAAPSAEEVRAAREALRSDVFGGRRFMREPVALRGAGGALPAEPRDRVHAALTGSGLVWEELQFHTEEGPQGWVALRIVRPPTASTAATAAAPTQPRLPAVILLHQTGGCKETMLQMQMEYARGGYLCAAMDSRYHGERGSEPGVLTGALCAYNDALVRAWRRGSRPTDGRSGIPARVSGSSSTGKGNSSSDSGNHGSADDSVSCSGGGTEDMPARGEAHAGAPPADDGNLERPFLIDTVFDVLHLVTVLAARADVDAARIGVTGISLGGMHAFWAAALDERIACAAPMIGVQHWQWAIENNQWQGRVDSLAALFAAAAADLGVPSVTPEVVTEVWTRLLPGLLRGYDLPALLPCVCPRPLLIANGELDPRCPLDGVLRALPAARAAYSAAGAPRMLHLLAEPGLGHATSPEMLRAVREWMDVHLMEGAGRETTSA